MNTPRHSGQRTRHSGPSTSSGQAALRSGRNPANKITLLAFVLIASAAWHASAHAAELGRLFYTPQQRLQLEAQQSTGESVEGGKRNSIMVNGVIQKQGGKRIVWINGTQQPAGVGNEKAPSTVQVTVPGKSQPVQLKVGQRLLLDTQVPDKTDENNSVKTAPAKPAAEEDD